MMVKVSSAWLSSSLIPGSYGFFATPVGVVD